MKKLPEAFLIQRQPLLGEEWDSFLQSYNAPRTYGLRCNPLRDCKKLPFCLTPIPWTTGGYYYNPQEQPGKHPLHETGVYYIQEPSAMAVVSLLEPQPGERICDLCAAPGGKSTQIAGILRGQGLLVCNDPIASRARVLSQNIERMGISNALVCNESPERMAAHFPLLFDRVLVDAPCSGEGMFRKDDIAIEEWSPENVTQCAKRQKMILNNADLLLQPGGTLVYSTCTFSPDENEEMIAWFLHTHPDYTLVDWRETALGEQTATLPDYAGLSSGISVGISGDTEQAPDLSGALRLWPHRVKGEGHFAARLHKAGTPISPGRKRNKKSSGHSIPPGLAAAVRQYQSFASDFLTENHENISTDQLELFGDNLLQIPDSFSAISQTSNTAQALSGVRLLRTGLQLGTIKKNRFEPAHALAKTLTPKQVRFSVSCCLSDASRYLHGETLPCENHLKGWTLVCYEGQPLGWGKAQNGILKNHFPKGLRIPANVS